MRTERKRDEEAAGPTDDKLTCPISMQLRRKAEKETMRELAKKPWFSVKDTFPKLFINIKMT